MLTGSYESVLFVGTGGGNDVFSTVLASHCLREYGVRWGRSAIAGVVSPFHRHELGSTVFPGVGLVTPTSVRRLSRRGDLREIGFVDARVSQLVRRGRIMTDCVYALSLERGAEGMAESFAALAREFELIVLVDVGGDIFFDGEDPHVISPMFDAMTLRGFTDSGAKGVLFEAGPGTDGEIEPESLVCALDHSGGLADAHPIPLDAMTRWAALYGEHVAPVRPGNTVPRTIEAYCSSEPVLTVPHRLRAHLGDVRCHVTFTQRIVTDLCKKFYLVDPKRVLNPFAVPCDSPAKWFWLTQVLWGRTSNEASLEYFQHEGRQAQFLTPSPLLPRVLREQLLLRGLHELHAGITDVVWTFPDDWERVRGRVDARLRAEEGALCEITR